MSQHIVRFRIKPLLALFAVLSIALAFSIAISSNGAQASLPSSLAAAPAPPPQSAGNEQPFDCARIAEFGINKQTNIRAQQIMAACRGEKVAAPSGDKANGSNAGSNGASKPAHYLFGGGTDANVSGGGGDGAFPKVTQSESFVWANGNSVIAAYNDARTSPSCYGGYSWSSDGGTSWTRPGGAAGASPLCSGHGTNFGDPTVVYSQRDSKWYLSFLATGCGGQGIGMWESTDGQVVTPGACAHSGSSDDRQSHWIDNGPSSPHYGRQYISWNNFAAGQNIYVVYSDNGTTWSAPVQVQTGGFIRNVQLTGSPVDGTVFIAGMNEGGGGLGQRTNIMYRSTNGGAAWTAATMGVAFPGPGVSTSGYFALMFPTIWRFMGWGQPAVGPNQVVHYTYTQKGTGVDPADQMYTRSTDNGTTWSVPIRFDQDTTTTQRQWQGSMAATTTGGILGTWYDAREATTQTCGTPGQNVPCYRRYGRVSLDNGATWQAEEQIGDVVSPLPAQPDGSVQATYEGDYDYSSANGNWGYTTWTDGRVLINGTSQQDVFFDKINLSTGPTATPCNPSCTPTRTNTPANTNTPTRTPTATATVCGLYGVTTRTATIIPGTTDTGNHGDDVATHITFPFPVRLYNNLTYTEGDVISNGSLQFTTADTTFTNTCMPVATFNAAIIPHWDDLRTDSTGTCSPGPCGIYTAVLGTAPNRTFIIEWRTYYFSGAGTTNFEIILHEGSTDFEVVIGSLTQTGAGATTGVQDDLDARVTQVQCNTGLTNNTQYAFVLAGCGSPIPTHTVTITPTPCVNCPTNTRTLTPSITVTPACTPGWSTVAPMLSPLLDSAVASQGGIVYSFAGVIAGVISPNSYKYDPAANVWTAIAPLPAGREQASAVSSGTHIYILGGADTTGANTNTVYRYDPVANTYTTMTPFTVATWAAAAAYVNGAVYKIAGCGANCTTFLNAVEKYDVAAGTWSTVANYPLTIGWLMAVGHSGAVYAAGGINTAASTKTYKYDPVANTWDDASVADLAVGRWGSASDIVAGNWVLAGGYAPTAVSNTGVSFNLANPGVWTATANLVHERARFGGATVGNNFYTVGGRSAAGGFGGTVETQKYTGSCGPTPTTGPSLTPTRSRTPGGPTDTPSATRSATPCAAGYVYATGTATIVPGTTDTGNHGDDVATNIALPFPFSLYGVSYTSANVISNGNLQFATTNTAFTNTCLPVALSGAAIMPFWEDFRTDTTGTCTPTPCGVFTSVSGTAPNRIFNIEWRVYYFAAPTTTANFEIRLYETGGRFDTIIGTLANRTSGTTGVQDGTLFTQYQCNTTIADGLLLIWTAAGCPASPTPGLSMTPTSTPTVTRPPVTNTSTITVTRTPGSPTMTPTIGSPTAVPTRTMTGTSTMTVTGTPPTATPTNTPCADCPTETPTMTPTVCPITFSDVNTPDYFYVPVLYLACRGVISGYNDGTFRPYNSATRSQMTKIIVLAEGWALEPPAEPTFTDVPPDHAFYAYVETAVAHGVISGYTCGADCLEFRPFSNVTRGQTAKIVVLAEEWVLIPPPEPHFSDVPVGSPFYEYVESAYKHGIISGYADGTFRPGADVTRGQLSKIVHSAIIQP